MGSPLRAIRLKIKSVDHVNQKNRRQNIRHVKQTNIMYNVEYRI